MTPVRQLSGRRCACRRCRRRRTRRASRPPDDAHPSGEATHSLNWVHVYRSIEHQLQVVRDVETDNGFDENAAAEATPQMSATKVR
jgi:hypothetical protein